ncbi:MAG: pyridoxamine 5'-phosphate oxidase family protein [Bacteroidota bacterium]
MSDSHENIQGAEALEKIKTMASHARTCQMHTALDKRPISTRPMGLHKATADGTFRFLSHKDSLKNREISSSNEMQLTISNDGDSEYMSVFGTATISRNQADIDELYNKFADNWFDGKDDPNITVIYFTPKEGRYCDTKHGKMIQFAGMLIGAITGKNASDGVEGNLSV